MSRREHGRHINEQRFRATVLSLASRPWVLSIFRRADISCHLSKAGIRANYLASLYTASKHAIVGFAKAMGQADIDEGVRINCILPGLVSSPLWHDREDNMIDWGKFDGRKQLQPSDIAEVMLKMVQSKEYEGGKRLRFSLSPHVLACSARWR